MLVPNGMEASSEEDSEVLSAVREVELACLDVIEPDSLVAASPLGWLCSSVVNGKLGTITVHDDSQVEVPVFTVMGSPDCLVLSVIEREVDSYFIATVEQGPALALLLDPGLELLSHELHLEVSHCFFISRSA